jgi:dTDP-4-amino-4,6-dideoxygalactose transaminase
MKKISAARPFFPKEDVEAILADIEKILQSGRLILGEYTSRFEECFRNYVGAGQAVAVSSCTAALQITLRFFRSKGREVILPANNFPGVVSAVLDEGAHPVLADMDPHTFCLDVNDAIGRVTPRTAGMIVVHIAGLVCPEVDRLREFCEKKGLFLIEDASHAHGAEIAGRKAGTLADAACFSFYPTKILATGTGGMITTSNKELAGFARSVRHHGQGERREQFIRPGNDWCLSEMHAAVGLQQLRRLDENVQRRNRIVELYRERLQGQDWLTIPVYPSDFRHAYYKFPVLLRAGLDRDRMRDTLEGEFQIENGTIYDPPCHLQPAFQQLWGLRRGLFPNAESTLARQLCPPIHSGLSGEDVAYVTDVMKTVAHRLGFV